MDSLADSNKSLCDAFEHLAFSQKAKSRLKNGLDMEKVISGQSVTFELDPDFEGLDSNAELALDIDDSDDEEFFKDLDDASTPGTSTASRFLSKKTQSLLSSSQDGATFSALANTDELISSDFTSLSLQMTPIFRDDLVKKLVVRPGTCSGAAPSLQISDNCKVIAHYVAICEGADEPHDSTLLRRCPQIFDLRQADILPGLFIALKSMTLGEVSKFIVKSQLAFGAHGCYPRVPPSADILFIVEILQVISAEQLQDPNYLTAEERAKLPFPQILESASDLRTKGNGEYKNGAYHSAIRKYRKGAAMLEDYPLAGQKDEDLRTELLHTLYCNLAQCYLKLERWPQACTVCKLGLRSSAKKGTAGQGRGGAGQNVKLLYRFATAKFHLKDYDGALTLCNDALKLDPKNVDLSKLRQQSSMELAKQTTASNQMFKGIFK